MHDAVLDIEQDDRTFVDKAESGSRFRNTSWAEKIQQLVGDSASFDFSPYHGTVDLVFVDGSHAYPYVRNDTEVAFQLLKSEGGTIVWHDYDTTWPGVTQALNEYYDSDERFLDAIHIGMTSLVVLHVARKRDA